MVKLMVKLLLTEFSEFTRVFSMVTVLNNRTLIYTGCPIINGTVDFQYIASGKLSIFLRHRIKYFPQKRMTPKSLKLMK